MLLKFLHAGEYPADHIAIRIVFADRKALLILNRHTGYLLFKNLESDSGHGLIRVSPFAFAIRTLNHFPVRLFEIHIKRLIIVAKAQVVHCKALISGFHTLGSYRQFKFLLLLCLYCKFLSFKVALCLHGAKALCGNIRTVCYMVSHVHHILQRVPLSVLGHNFILRALVMKRHAVLIDIL